MESSLERIVKIKQISTLLSFVFMFQFYVCQNKHALIIAIGNYPDKWENNWTDISSLNDVGLIKNMLKDQKFDSSNTTILKDQSATVNNIENALEELILKAKKEDIIYIHYSGHGQQVPDLEKSKNKYLHKDEQDGWDEALVTYNAPAKFEEQLGYNYEHHFIDDQFNFYVNRLREKTGKKGQIIVVLDACHSGTGTRGSNELGKARGTSIPCAPKGYIPKINNEASKNKYTENDFNYSPNLNLGALTVFSGCKADQVNRECEDDNGTPYGSLSYYLVKAMSKLGDNASYRNLFDEINARMAIEFSNEQQPVIEGDELDQLIFKGTFIKQEPYFKVEKLESYSKEATIAGGSLQGLQEGDSIGLYFHSVLDPKEAKAEYTAVITNTSVISSTLNLDRYFEGKDNEFVNYRAFLTKSKLAPLQISLKLDIKNKKLKKELKKRLEILENVNITDLNYTYTLQDTILNNDKSKIGVIVYLAHNGLPLRNMLPMQLTEDEHYSRLIEILNYSVKAKLFRELKLSDDNIDIEIKKPSKVILKNGDSLKFTIKNNWHSPIYLYFVDIKPDETMSLVPEINGIQIYPNTSIPINGKAECGSSDDPCGKEQIKIICSMQKIPIDPLLRIGRSLNSNRGNDNPLEEFIKKEIKGTRSWNFDKKINILTDDIIFEINN